MNKQKKLKLILSSFKQKQLIKFFQTFLDAIKSKFYKSIKQISFSCYQSTCQVQNYMVNGYGKTSSQALLSGINNLIDCLIQQEQYCEIMRNCLRKFNVTPYGLNQSSANNGTASKKQLLSTQKALKTVGPQTSMSLEKKVLTMSANLSSNSKQSSSKGKSIKQQIFQYFNLQNLKVKNPSQQFSTVSPMAANSLKSKKSGLTLQNPNILSKSKQKYIIKQSQYSTKIYHPSTKDKQLEQVFQRIRQVQQKIQFKQKQNKKLKQQITKKKKNFVHKQSNQNKNHHQTTSSQNVLINVNKLNTQPAAQNYFTRPSLEKQKKPPNVLSTTQSNKKISYLEMSLNQKFNQKEKENFKSFMTSSVPNQVSNNYKVNEKPMGNYGNHNTENQFQKIDLAYSKNHQQKSLKTQQANDVEKEPVGKWNTHQNPQQIQKMNDQRKCLVDISNYNPKNEGQKHVKNNDYSTFNVEGNFKNSSSVNSSAFQTINGNYHHQNSHHHPNSHIANSILYSKVSQQNQESLSIIESSKKLRSFSVQNSLAQKVNNNPGYGSKNPMTIISGGKLNNTSFDNINTTLSSSVGINQHQKKIKIPKLNLQILPNYHGKSNKSLNQSLMEIYEKKNQSVTPFNE